MPCAAAELILNSRRMSVTSAYYARITAAADGVPTAMLWVRFLNCQAVQPELIVGFASYTVHNLLADSKVEGRIVDFWC